MSETITVDEHTIEVGNPDKVLFPKAGITKRDLVEYYQRIGEEMLPHVRGRPVTMHRFPDGIDGSGFYQKNTPDYFPDWIRTVEVTKEGGTVTHVIVDDTATLVYLADQACITPHVWLSTVDHLDRPDRLVFDLDPPDEGGLDTLRLAARAVRDLLDEFDLRSRLMTTGSAGYHIVVPLDGKRRFDDVREFAHRSAKLLAARHPNELTVEQRISNRSDRVFLDYLRNGYAQTTVAPHAVRAIPEAPVATPIEWDELASVEPRAYRLDSIFRRLGQKADPWLDDGIGAQSLDTAAERLDDLDKE